MMAYLLTAAYLVAFVLILRSLMRGHKSMMKDLNDWENDK